MFSYIVTSKVYVGLRKTALFDYFFTVKGEKFCPFQGCQGPQPKFKDFPGPGIFFCQFQDFQRPWQPCVVYVVVLVIIASGYGSARNCVFIKAKGFFFFLLAHHQVAVFLTYDRVSPSVLPFRSQLRRAVERAFCVFFPVHVQWAQGHSPQSSACHSWTGGGLGPNSWTANSRLRVLMCEGLWKRNSTIQNGSSAWHPGAFGISASFGCKGHTKHLCVQCPRILREGLGTNLLL